MPLIPALRRQRGRQISEFEFSLDYKVSSRTARAKQRNPVSEKQNKTKQNKRKTKEIHFPKLDRNDVFPMEGSSLKE